MSTGRLVGAALLVAMVAVTATTGGAERPQQPPPPESRSAPRRAQPDALKGACYLTFAERLECTGETTEAECRQHCDDLLCDSYNWLDRLPCWNWGYGG